MSINIEGNVKFRSGRYLIPGKIWREETSRGNARLVIQFRYDEYVKDEIKAMEGCRWLGFDDINPRKLWSVTDCERNRFQLGYLTGQNVYEHYDKPLIDYKSKRSTYNHQDIMTSHGITRRHCIWAVEMGAGKTLSAIEVIEYSGFEDWYWIGPKSALASVQLEFYKWNAKVWPKFVTYEALIKIVENWPSGKPAPRGVIFDESSRVKNPTAQRSKAAKYLADQIREEWGIESYIILMSGSPAPKSPADWFFQCEIAQPGFIREGNIEKFKRRLGLIIQAEGFDGGSYPKLITWFDDERKCKKCGQFEDDDSHNPIYLNETWFHSFEKSVNEISYLYKRMSGLVLVQFKRDLLDLPEKQYRRIICKPLPETVRAMHLILAGSPTTIQGLTLCRELSDGFQYQQTEIGKTLCPTCKGSKEADEFYDIDEPNHSLTREELETGKRVIYNQEGVRIDIKSEPYNRGNKKIACHQCNQTGQVPIFSREVKEVPCPKEDALIDLLEQYEEEGRVVLWGGFTATIDRLTRICVKQGWEVIRCDGRGWQSNIPGEAIELLKIFQNGQNEHPKIAFVGQQGSGGMGLNLTSSSMACYYSNTFKAEDRIQSEDRIHRIGADKNRGVTIYDLIHLPTDIKVLDNLQEKKDLQSLSLGLMKKEIDDASKYIENYRLV